MAALLFLSGACLGTGPAFVAAQDLETAGELIVELDARDLSEGPVSSWVNTAPESNGDFVAVGEPVAELVDGIPAVTFNGANALQSLDPAPASVVGLDATCSIEVWAFNPAIGSEETLVAWSHRGGPDGTNMSFNYGSHGAFGAVGHWGAPDIGWNDAGGAPAAGEWHHLVYTYDGETTRVYADGCVVDEINCETNSEFLGAGVINTHPENKITLAAQLVDVAGAIDFGPRAGTLSLARVRVHTEALSAEQILQNHDEERPDFVPPDSACVCENCPESDATFAGRSYVRRLRFDGDPAPTFRVTAPAGATLDANGVLRYAVPAGTASFDVSVECSNDVGTEAYGWTVTAEEAPSADHLEIAGDLLVDLRAEHRSAGSPVWLNAGTLADFLEVGDPIPDNVSGVDAVSFNGAAALDAYQCAENAPPSIVGLDPSRSIEVWAFNPAVAVEETLVAWGRRGGPDGSNMSFNYGNHGVYGAVGHWGGPDIGWNDAGGAPEAGVWHHLVYTYDGEMTSVYADGCLVDEANCAANSEFLGGGVINTHDGSPITLVAQIDDVANNLNAALRGTLSLARVRVHSEALAPDQVLFNFEEERGEFLPDELPSIQGAPASDRHLVGVLYRRTVTVRGTPRPEVTLTSPEGAVLVADGSVYSILYDPVDLTAGDSFTVVISASALGNVAEARWEVTLREPGPIEIAEDLLVDLDAANVTAGSLEWDNCGSLGGVFNKIGDPVAEIVAGAPAVTFNAFAQTDAYQHEVPAPDGLVGLDPTRSIEVWAYNEFVDGEETLVSWGRRGGPDGTNMSFNYGSNGAFGAVGHWGGPDIGWDNAGGAPVEGVWHHLVYTYDGTTTRVYADGALANSEVLGPGVINTHGGSPITLAVQIADDLGTLDFSVRVGSVSLGRVRVHDGVLSDEQIANNFAAERPCFLDGECEEETECEIVDPEPRFVRGDADSSGVINLTDGVVTLQFLFNGGPPPACMDAADADDSGGNQPAITDAVIVFQWLFNGGAAPASPSPTSTTYPAANCGTDMSADGMDCVRGGPVCS